MNTKQIKVISTTGKLYVEFISMKTEYHYTTRRMRENMLNTISCEVKTFRDFLFFFSNVWLLQCICFQVCSTWSEFQEFVESIKKSSHPNDKALHDTLVHHLLPSIQQKLQVCTHISNTFHILYKILVNIIEVHF
jgi:hypothetical protein